MERLCPAKNTKNSFDDFCAQVNSQYPDNIPTCRHAFYITQVFEQYSGKEAQKRLQWLIENKHVNLNCSIIKHGTVSILESYLAHGIQTGNFLPSLVLLTLGADPEFSISNTIPPLQFITESLKEANNESEL